MSIGIVSTLTEYDSSGPSAIVYTGRGNLKSPRRTQRGFPEYQVGSVIGCAVDVKKRVAVFTRDGKLIGETTLSSFGKL